VVWNREHAETRVTNVANATILRIQTSCCY
jgi:hypothetical protein